jgi:hypothetical protein
VSLNLSSLTSCVFNISSNDLILLRKITLFARCYHSSYRRGSVPWGMLEAAGAAALSYVTKTLMHTHESRLLCSHTSVVTSKTLFFTKVPLTLTSVQREAEMLFRQSLRCVTANTENHFMFLVKHSLGQTHSQDPNYEH